MEANPHHPRRYELILGVNEYRLVRCRRTVDEVVRASQGGSLWTSVVLAAAHRRMGDRAAVGDALRGRIARGNGVARSARELHAKWFDPPLVEHLVDGLSKAGLGDAGVIPQGGHRARVPETPACRT